MNFMPAGRQGFYEAESAPSGSGGGGVAPPPDDGEGPAAAPIEREHMFDKVVTPSDVGKLNRLVIPKQHAERYFPLDSAANEKGLLLNFEDRNGKPWRFRYSYWNSSQSYVMTKGWSRFVKDKKLDAGDTVSFHRGHLLKDRLFIDWRRRPEPLPDLHHHHFSSAFHYRPPPPNPWGTLPYSPFLHNNSYQYQYQCQYHPSIMYLPRGRTQMPVQQNMDHRMVFESVPVVQGNKAAAKRLRLFGVNMDCQISDSDNNECDVLVLSSSSAATTMPSQYHPPFDSSSSSSSSSLARLRQNDGTDYKGKGSVSLNFDI